MWPNESTQYRQARQALLQKEAQLRALAEDVAQTRRSLPKGGSASQDYIFKRVQDASQVTLSELFEEGSTTLFTYSFMFKSGSKPCSMCVSLLDSLNSAAGHIQQRVNLAIIAKAAPDDLKQLAASRNWDKLKIYSSQENSYNLDYQAEDEAGNQLPIMHVWQKDNETIRHFWASELFLHEDEDWPHQKRHADMIWPLWNVLDLTPQGRGDWYPSVEY